MADPAQTRGNAAAAEDEAVDWTRCLHLPCEFTVEVPLPSVRLADLLALKAGSILESRWKVGSDVPTRVNGVVIAWCEFEVVGDRLGVRLTDLA